MRKPFKAIISFCLIFFYLSAVHSVHAIDFPAAKGYVNDFAQVLTSEQQATLEATLREFDSTTTNEIVVVTLPSLEGEEINDYSTRLFETWKIGKRNQDNGVLILAAIEEREVRIELGYGIEPYVTDAQAGTIIRSSIAPAFDNQNYYQGLYLATNDVMNILNKTNAYASGSSYTAKDAATQRFYDSSKAVGLIISLIIYIASFMARSKSIYLGGIMGGILGVFFGSMSSVFGRNVGIANASVWLIGVITLCAIFGLFLDWLLSKNYKTRQSNGRSTDWWSSGGGFLSGGSSGSGRFGGFGGGRSGGGGASGRW